MKSTHITNCQAILQIDQKRPKAATKGKEEAQKGNKIANTHMKRYSAYLRVKICKIILIIVKIMIIAASIYYALSLGKNEYATKTQLINKLLNRRQTAWENQELFK